MPHLPALAVVAVARIALDLGHDVRVGSVDMRDGAFNARELLVVAPALVGVGLRQRRELGGPFRVGALEDGEARLGGHEVADRDRRRLRVELERLAALDLGGLEAVQRPVAALDRVLLVGHRLAHVDAVGDAGAVGDDERRPGQASASSSAFVVCRSLAPIETWAT